MIKLIASDLDGTLLTDKKELTDATRLALDTAIAQGIQFVPATGRSFKAVPDMIKYYPGVEYVITANGGAVYSVSGQRRIYQCVLTPESVKAVLAAERPEYLVLEVFIEGVPYSGEAYVKDPMAFGASEYGARYVQATRTPIKDMEAFAMEHCNKLDSMAFICPEPEKKAEFERLLLREVPDIYVTSSVPHLLEIGHRDAGKGNTLLWLLKRLGISPEEAMAFGDADNDSSMLTAVKYGTAVANGTPGCKAAAAYETACNEEDGVAKAIMERLKAQG